MSTPNTLMAFKRLNTVAMVNMMHLAHCVDYMNVLTTCGLPSAWGVAVKVNEMYACNKGNTIHTLCAAEAVITVT